MNFYLKKNIYLQVNRICQFTEKFAIRENTRPFMKRNPITCTNVTTLKYLIINTIKFTLKILFLLIHFEKN